jgi:hypothetical protein
LVRDATRIRPGGIATHASAAGKPKLHKFNECPRRGDARVFLHFFIADQKRAPVRGKSAFASANAVKCGKGAF